MMRLPRFRYHAPATLGEALEILAGEGPEAAVLAGGTDLLPNMKRRHQAPKTLVSLGRLPELAGVRAEKNELRIGPMTTLAAAARHPAILGGWPALARAAGVVSTPILRNMGTLGGNLCLDTRCNYYNQSYEWRRAIDFCLKWEGATCWVAPSSARCYAVNSSDTAPVACALGARLRLASAGGEREIAAHELYRMDGKEFLARRPDELLVEITLPAPAGWSSDYRKLARRGAFDFPVLGVAAAVRRDGDRPDGVVREARVWLNAVASAPLRVEAAEAALTGAPLSPETIARAAECAWRPARPMDNTDLNYAWRKTMVRVETARLLTTFLARRSP